MVQKGTEKKTTGKSAFTLVEVMTAVTILALIAAVTFSIVFGAVKRSRFIDLDLQLRNEAFSIVTLVAEDIRGAYIREGVVPYFRGEDRYMTDIPTDRVGLLTSAVLPVTPNAARGSFGEVEYYTSGDETEKLVLVRREQAPGSPPYDVGGGVFEVTDRLAYFDVSYFDGEEWYDEWDAMSETGPGAGVLPREVRITLSLEDKGHSVTYTTVVAPVMSVGR